MGSLAPQTSKPRLSMRDGGAYENTSLGMREYLTALNESKAANLQSIYIKIPQFDLNVKQYSTLSRNLGIR
jgi:hypothetical protein